jgi:hypothetical protein
MPIIKIQELVCSPLTCLLTIDRIAKPLTNAAQTLEDHDFEEPKSQQPWHREICLFARQLEEYSNEAHLSAVWQ